MAPHAIGDEAALRQVERLGRLLDTAFRVPGTRWRFGLDGLLGLVPGVGDGLSAALSLYPVYLAWRLGAPPALLIRMMANVGVDAAIGAVPLLGDIFDFAFKANRRNTRILRTHLEERRGRTVGPG